jgi:hypothetical protein
MPYLKRLQRLASVRRAQRRVYGEAENLLHQMSIGGLILRDQNRRVARRPAVGRRLMAGQRPTSPIRLIGAGVGVSVGVAIPWAWDILDVLDMDARRSFRMIHARHTFRCGPKGIGRRTRA